MITCVQLIALQKKGAQVDSEYSMVHTRKLTNETFISGILDPQTIPLTSPKRASYGVSFVNSCETINRVITAPFCTLQSNKPGRHKVRPTWHEILQWPHRKGQLPKNVYLFIVASFTIRNNVPPSWNEMFYISFINHFTPFQRNIPFISFHCN